MYHIFLIHSSVSEHLSCFHVLAIVNSSDHMVFILQLMWYIILIDLQIFKNPYISKIKSHLIVAYDLLMYCWSQFSGILLSIFVSVFISDIGL